MMRSTQQHHPMVDLVRYQLDASVHLAEAVFSSTEKIDRAMLDVTHQAVDGQLKLARAVTDMRDPERMAELQVSLASRPEKAMHCQQQIMTALVEIQAEFGKSIRNYLEKIGQTSAHQVEEAVQEGEAKAGLAQAGAAQLNPFTGMLSVWQEAFREAGRLASQNLMVASSNLENATAATHEAVSQAVKSTQPDGHRQSSPRARRQTGPRRKV